MYARRESNLVAAAGVALILTLSAGCASPAGTPIFRGARAPQDHQISVEVHNIGWADVTIYSVTGGSRLRLGLVASNTSRRFRLPREHEWATDLRLQADPVGSYHTYESENIAPSEGQVVRWTVHETRSFRALAVW